MFLIPTPYKFLIAILGAFSLLLGGFFYGRHVGNLDSKVAIANFNQKAQATQVVYQKVAGPATTKIVTQYVDRWHTIKENEDVNKQIAENVVPDHGILSNGWVRTYNNSAAATAIDPASAADATPSGVAANQALGTITDNNATCNSWKAQLNALLDAIEAHNNAIDQANSGKPLK